MALLQSSLVGTALVCCLSYYGGHSASEDHLNVSPVTHTVIQHWWSGPAALHETGRGVVLVHPNFAKQCFVAWDVDDLQIILSSMFVK